VIVIAMSTASSWLLLGSLFAAIALVVCHERLLVVRRKRDAGDRMRSADTRPELRVFRPRTMTPDVIGRARERAARPPGAPMTGPVPPGAARAEHGRQPVGRGAVLGAPAPSLVDDRSLGRVSATEAPYHDPADLRQEEGPCVRAGIVDATEPRVEHAFARNRRRRRAHQRGRGGRLRAVLSQLDAELLAVEGLAQVGAVDGTARRRAHALRFEARAAAKLLPGNVA